jgi:very-short-patch-repair endonuclease
VVVAGDGKQLPPTMFFKAAFDFDIEEPTEEQGEGLHDQVDLDIAAGAPDLLSLAEARLPDAHLNVHYRSLDPVLIAFSNATFYQNRLEVPPPAQPVTPDGTPALFLERVDGVYGTNRTNPEEARRVVDYLRGLWLGSENRPTVGIVTFNEAQREAIEDLLDASVTSDPEFRAAYERELTRTDGGQDVGFFVKSLEAVQGDERDVILFSTTYGRREDGRFVRSFLGPINAQGGERRLNVAVTRARLWVRIFTSLPIHELASALTPGAVETRDAAGRAALQLYLAYAERISNGDSAAAEAILQRSLELAGGLGEHPGPVGPEESEFEIEVRQALRQALDLEVDAQVGSGSFRIDLAVRAREGGYILGIECDGKAYHSAPSARAYDYWRQSVLERRGWQIHRIWSTAWRNDPAREIAKIQGRIQHLLRAARADRA